MNNYNSSIHVGGGNSNYNIIRTPSKAEFDKIVNTDLNGTLNSNLNIRITNVWNYIDYRPGGNHVFDDTSTFQDNTNNTSTRFYWHLQNGVTYPSVDKNYCAINPDPGHTIISANFRPIIEYRE